MSSVTRIEIGTRPGFTDSRGLSTARKIREHLGLTVQAVRTRDVYLIEPALDPFDARRVAEEFAGPVVRQGAVGRIEDGPFDVIVSVGFKPGVTDPVGKSARKAIEDLLGRPLPAGSAVFSGRLYLLTGPDRRAAERIAKELLANEMIERVAVATYAEWQAAPPDLTVPRVHDSSPRPVETIDLELPDEALVALSKSRLLALSLEEMQAVRNYFIAAGTDPRRQAVGLSGKPTDVELEVLAQTWSEHCKHKIFSATINYLEEGQEPREIRSLFKSCIRAATENVDRAIHQREGKSWLISVFHDNAGVIAATPRHHLVYKVETHNSPSALDPYGGAITGIVGVNRDPFGTGIGAELLSNVWGYCFGPTDYTEPLPPGLLHPQRIRDGVHAGVIDGGNQSGIPYGRGWEFFDARFLGKPLVFCGTVGRMPVAVQNHPAEVKRTKAGDRIVMVGGRIGKDGIHGATFSSAELTEESPVQAVQIGDPITQKMMFDFLLEARDQGLYSALTDNGAGGLSSSVGEMAQLPGGARLDLAQAPLKYQGLAPWEILVSEAQERMTLAVPPARLPALLDLAARREVEATDLGEFTADGYFHVTYGAETVALLPLEFLHEGCPVMNLTAEWRPAPLVDIEPQAPPESAENGNTLLDALLARPNIASNELLARTYDHEVKGLTVIQPWIGAYRDIPADGTVFMIDHTGYAGYALAEGVFPTYSDHDAGAMAQAGIDLAVRRVIAAGARPDRIAALDNYCWPDPLESPSNPDARHKLAQLVRASLGLREICEAYGVPLISGKDSMKNDAVIAGRRISIPPTLLASAIGIVEDVRRARTLEPAGPGEALLIVGQTLDELGGTEWAAQRGVDGGKVPRAKVFKYSRVYAQVARLIEEDLVSGVHAVGRGGLLPALFFIARAGGLGIEANLLPIPRDGEVLWEAAAFGESLGRFVLSVPAANIEKVQRLLHDAPVGVLGLTTATNRLTVDFGSRRVIDAPVARFASAWKREKGNH